MVDGVIRFVVLGLVRLFYRRIEILGAVSYLFRYPVLGRIMRAFGALPVYRDHEYGGCKASAVSSRRC